MGSSGQESRVCLTPRTTGRHHRWGDSIRMAPSCLWEGSMSAKASSACCFGMEAYGET